MYKYSIYGFGKLENMSLTMLVSLILKAYVHPFSVQCKCQKVEIPAGSF